MEISIIREYQLLVDYKSLNRKQEQKLYNLAVLGVAVLNLNNVKYAFKSWEIFGINSTMLLMFIGFCVVATLLSSMATKGFSKKKFLNELLWLLVALIPAIIGLLFMMIDLPIYI